MRAARFLLDSPGVRPGDLLSGEQGKVGKSIEVTDMFEFTAFGAIGLVFAIAALLGSIVVENCRERRDLAELDELLDRLGVAEGAISVDQFAPEEPDETGR